jgi:CheY-like chemotaxis protein
LKPSGGEEALIEAAIFAQRHAEVLREVSETIAACEQSAGSLREQKRAARASESPASSLRGSSPPAAVPAVLEEDPANDDGDTEGPVTQVDPRFRRVLVVDDEPAVLRAFRRVLQRDYDVLTARSGSEALRIVLSDSHLDGILCDLAMPELDGPAFFSELKELCPQLLPRVVFITGGIATEKSQHFVEGLETPVLHKPVAADALLKALESVRL